MGLQNGTDNASKLKEMSEVPQSWVVSEAIHLNSILVQFRNYPDNHIDKEELLYC